MFILALHPKPETLNPNTLTPYTLRKGTPRLLVFMHVQLCAKCSMQRALALRSFSRGLTLDP